MDSTTIESKGKEWNPRSSVDPEWRPDAGTTKVLQLSYLDVTLINLTETVDGKSSGEVEPNK